MTRPPFDPNSQTGTVFTPAPAAGRPLPAAPPAPLPPAASPAAGWEAATPATPAPPADGVPAALALPGGAMGGPNRLLNAAAPMLLLIGNVRTGRIQAPVPELMAAMAELLGRFETVARDTGVDRDDLALGRYLLCATADDIVQNVPSEDHALWLRASMLSRYFGERVGGVRFFDLAERAIADPARQADGLELLLACLALGFQGRYRTDSDGAAQLSALQTRLHEALRRVRAVPEDLSPHWRGIDLPARNGRRPIPVWAVAAAALAAAGIVYVAFLTRLASETEAVASEISGLHPPVALALRRPLPAPPPPAPPPEPPPPANLPPARMTQMQRIRAALGPEIAAGEIGVQPAGAYIIVRVNSAFLFGSGQATLGKTGDLVPRLARMLDGESGPILVIGHTDDVPVTRAGRFKSNLALSRARADAVVAALRPVLAEPGRLSPEGRGEQEPLAPNDSAANRAANRRVDIRIDRVD